jgi:hypothetical protein
MHHQAHIQGEVGVPVERGIEKRAEGRDAPDQPRHLTVGHIQKRGQKQDRRRLTKSTHGEQRGRPGIHGETEEGEHIRREAGGSETPDDMAQ